MTPFGTADTLRGAADSGTVIAPLGQQASPFIILLSEPAAGAADSPLPRSHGRVDMQSAATRSYVQRIREGQQQFLQDAGARLGRPLASIDRRFEFQHAVNGLVARITPAEALKLAQDPRVARIVPLAVTRLSTDMGPAQIGAPIVWGDGPSSPDGIFGGGFEVPAPGNRGEGMVVGVIDTGLNFDSPSFAASAAGYTHENPLGEGTYLGLCSAAQESSPAAPECNSKVIGAWDFVDPLLPDVQAYDPAATDGPGAEDENGHGSHTAGTAAGNPVHASIHGGTRSISGVAPRANLVVYDACYTTGSGQGSCLNVSLLAAINQAVADGVDVINYSIGGGLDPWSDPIAMAMLSANQAGIFVAAAAGNSGPYSESVGHVEPWVTTVAASTHGRGAFHNLFSVTGPAPVPAALQDVVVTVAGDGAPLVAPIEAELAHDPAAPLLCDPVAAGSLQGRIAVVGRGTCTFDTKVINAQDAGAVAMVLYNSADAALNPSMPSAAIPVVTVGLTTGTAIADFAVANPGTTGLVDHPAKPLAQQPDQVARFSSRGPSTLSQVKPDLAAPGVAIIAPVAGDADAYGVYNGTSMATPHVAGAAALLMQQQPGWSPEQVKSALMLTAETAMTLEETGEAAGPLQRGAGRIQVDQAVSPGLLLEQAALDYNLADPRYGGRPDQLNLASFNQTGCVGACSWERTVSNVSGRTVTWNATLEGLPGTVSPGAFTLEPGASQAIGVEVDAAGLAELDAFLDGQLVLSPDDAGLPVVRMPVVVHAAPPSLSLGSDTLTVSVPAGEAAATSLRLGNTGNGSIDWSVVSGAQRVPTVYQPKRTLNGLVSTAFTSTGTAALLADDFVVTVDAELQRIDVEGFFWGPYQANMTDYADMLHWEIYADLAGFPAGGPGVVGGAAPVWSHSAAPDAPGVVPGIDMELDLVAAGLIPPTLPPGRYWLVAYPDFPAPTWDGYWWYRHISDVQSGLVAKSTNNEPAFGGTPGAPLWSDITLSWGGHYDAAMVIEANQACGAEWLSAGTLSGTVGTAGSTDIAITVDASGLAEGSHSAQLCVQTNDPQRPWVLLPVHVEVTAPVAPGV